MSNELTIPGGDNKLTLPAHIAARFKPEDSNILTGDRTPALTIKGKVFTITKDGETNKLMKKDEDGNEYPLASLPVFIIDYAAKMGRSYYKGAYDPNDVKPPTCWSVDSIVPEDDVEEKQHPKCAGCPQSVKGSSITDRGQSAVACSLHRMLAVVSARRMDLGALRLRIAQTSNFDGRSPEHKQKGMFAFQNYLDMLKARGIPHTQSVVTRLSFDPNQAYPKLLFSALRFTEDAELVKLDEIMASGVVEQILGNTSTSAIKANPALAAPRAVPALPAPKAATTAQTAAEADEEEIVVAGAATPQAKAEARQAEFKQTATEIDEEHELAAKLEKIRLEKKAKAEAEARAKAEAEAAAKAEAEAAAKAAAEPEDEEAALERQLAAARAKKAAAAAPTGAEATNNGAAAPKRTRRTKEQIAADEAKAAAVAKVGNEKFLPNTISGDEMGDEDDTSTMVIGGPAPTNGNGGAAAAAPKAEKAKVIEATSATAVQVPPEVASMLQSWDD